MKIKFFRYLFPIICMLMLAGCGSSADPIVTGSYYYPSKEETAEEDLTETAEEELAEAGQDATEAAEAVQEETPGADLFLITVNDMQAECLILKQLASGKQYMYNYSVATRFLDKYGNRATVSYFEPGRIINVGEKDIHGRLLEAQISDEVWEYPGITRYSVDEERGVFQIADTNYSYDEDLFICSDGTMLQLSDLTELDTLRVVGMGKKIYSVSVTTGHGNLKLTNTSLFDGSYIQIGKKIFSEITGEMTMELPEGTYTAAVANNGWGGSTEITISRGQETVLDLDSIKGEGPKYGSILFAVDVEGATVQIDGNVIDYSQPVELQYGVHTLTVTADSYDTYSKKLFVNSSEATIVIAMTGDGETSSGTSDESTDTSDESTTADGSTTDTADTTASGTGAGSLAGSLAGSTHSSGTGTDSSTDSVTNAASEAELDAIVDSLLDDGESDTSDTDYLSTLTELLTAIAGD